jgi:hypothetical protein
MGETFAKFVGLALAAVFLYLLVGPQTGGNAVNLVNASSSGGVNVLKTLQGR